MIILRRLTQIKFEIYNKYLEKTICILTLLKKHT